MDKAYVDFEALNRIDNEGGIFVTRAKDNMKYEIVSGNFNIDTSTGIMGDYLIRLTGYKSSKLYHKVLRLVEYCDQDSGEQLSFISNVVIAWNSMGWRLPISIATDGTLSRSSNLLSRT